MTALKEMADWATIVTAVSAVGGIIGIPLQLRESRRLQNESAAKQMYQSFLAEALGHPGLLNQTDDEVSAVAKRLDTGAGSPEDLQFDWLMYYALECFDSALLAAGSSNPMWRKRALIFFAQYPTYFGSNYYLAKVGKQFGAATNELAQKAVEHAKLILMGQYA